MDDNQFLHVVCISETLHNCSVTVTQCLGGSFTLWTVLVTALVGQILWAGLTQMSMLD